MSSRALTAPRIPHSNQSRAASQLLRKLSFKSSHDFWAEDYDCSRLTLCDLDLGCAEGVMCRLREHAPTTLCEKATQAETLPHAAHTRDARNANPAVLVRGGRSRSLILSLFGLEDDIRQHVTGREHFHATRDTECGHFRVLDALRHDREQPQELAALLIIRRQCEGAPHDAPFELFLAQLWRAAIEHTAHDLRRLATQENAEFLQEVNELRAVERGFCLGLAFLLVGKEGTSVRLVYEHQRLVRLLHQPEHVVRDAGVDGADLSDGGQAALDLRHLALLARQVGGRLLDVPLGRRHLLLQPFDVLGVPLADRLRLCLLRLTAFERLL
mmetsp:Transcript_16960/g.42658  ORF Transcript_16960/g.42658 Transcript_16960/m.42658 type:complete len:328 (+) Transcript_16960:164-1147(+)